MQQLQAQLKFEDDLPLINICYIVYYIKYPGIVVCIYIVYIYSDVQSITSQQCQCVQYRYVLQMCRKWKMRNSRKRILIHAQQIPIPLPPSVRDISAYVYSRRQLGLIPIIIYYIIYNPIPHSVLLPMTTSSLN